MARVGCVQLRWKQLDSAVYRPWLGRLSGRHLPWSSVSKCRTATPSAGGHLLEDEALLLLKWQLGGTVLAALHAELATGEARSNGSATGQAATAADADTAGVAGSSAAEAQQAQQRLGDRLSEKGVLQLLFDVRFLLDLLAGGRPLRWEALSCCRVGVPRDACWPGSCV